MLQIRAFFLLGTFYQHTTDNISTFLKKKENLKDPQRPSSYSQLFSTYYGKCFRSSTPKSLFFGECSQLPAQTHWHVILPLPVGTNKCLLSKMPSIVGSTIALKSDFQGKQNHFFKNNKCKSSQHLENYSNIRNSNVREKVFPRNKEMYHLLL